MADVTKLLHGAPEDASFLDKLELRPPERVSLESARTKIREALRAAFAAESKARFGVLVRPRFYTQGSYAYATLNRPAFPPRQRKDLDDGIYLPLNFMKGALPSLAAEAYFSFVDGVLKVLCTREGWIFTTRPTCARLIIGKDAHIDVPLYAIPDAQFETLAKSATAARVMAQDGADFDFMNVRRAAIDNWDALPSDEVLLAHREQDWKASDPRKIHEWFLRAVETYGEQLRRVCRYLKAWRDHQDEALENLSSICIMTCVFEAYDRPGSGPFDRRDDRSLLTVANRLPTLLMGPVLNPTDDTEKLCAKLSREERQRAIALAEVLAIDVKSAIEATDAAASIASLQHSFGMRLPNRPDLVRADAVTAAFVRAQPARVVPAPVVGRSISG